MMMIWVQLTMQRRIQWWGWWSWSRERSWHPLQSLHRQQCCHCTPPQTPRPPPHPSQPFSENNGALKNRNWKWTQTKVSPTSSNIGLSSVIKHSWPRPCIGEFPWNCQMHSTPGPTVHWLAAKVKRQQGERHLWLCTFKISLMKVCDTSTIICLLQQYRGLSAGFLLAP